MDFICSPIWVGWLVWMLHRPDREASLPTLQLYWSSTAIGFGPRSESGRYWADRADCRDLSGHSRFSAPPPLGRLPIIVSCDWALTSQADT